MSKPAKPRQPRYRTEWVERWLQERGHHGPWSCAVLWPVGGGEQVSAYARRDNGVGSGSFGGV